MSFADIPQPFADALCLWDNRPENFAPGGQRLGDIADAPDDLEIVSVREEGDAVCVVWNGGRGESRFPPAFLNGITSPMVAATPTPHLWRAADSETLHRADFRAVASEPSARREWLHALARDGIAFLRGVPAQDKIVLPITESFGFVRETNYGRYFDVRTEAGAANLAYSDLGLGLHTDNPYRDPVPGLQLLHCLRQSESGGESRFADGFSVGEEFRARFPEYFPVLTETPVPFRYRDATADLYAERPILALNRDGAIGAVHYNTRSIKPPYLAQTEMRTFYAAYREFARLLRDAALVAQIRLAEGDLVAFDNQRILHGRTAFTGTGTRHLQGCYADRDGLLSSLRILENRV